MSGDSDATRDTLPASAATTDTEHAGARGPASRLALPDYDIRSQLGRGGMGEVLLANDRVIEREIAIKRMVGGDGDPAAIERFVREAKIQARLEHPAIVPVHEIGTDEQGHPYFTMKRVSGTTLLDKLREPDLKPQRLLRALADVCRAIQLAHDNGVIHRDLKPANVMLGPYGEVYVLDWGIARVVGGPDGISASGLPASGQTQAGAVLGTLGYMAPDQLRDASTVGPKADVYALGCILYEILTGLPVHPRGAEAMTTTLVEDAVYSPRERAPDRDVPVELDKVCRRALAFEPANRPSARELAETIEAYLDGDRDLERRRAIATDHLTAARDALPDPARRAEAAREAGRAIALDPTSRDAIDLVRMLTLSPPRERPPELVAKLERVDQEMSQASAAAAVRMLLPFLLLLPVIMWSGIHDWSWLIGSQLLCAVIVAVAYRQARFGKTNDYVGLVCMTGLTIVASRYAGLFMFMPIVAIPSLMGLGQQAPFIRRPIYLVIATLAMFGVPWALEQAGVFATTQTVEHGTFAISSEIFDINSRTYIAIAIVHVVVCISACFFGRSLGQARLRALQDTEIQRWHLEQLVGVGR